MPRVACLDLPALPLQLVWRSEPTWRAHPVVVIEKARGRLLLDKQVRFDHQNFLSLKVDHKNGTIDLTKPMCRIAITPDDATTVAGP